MAINRMQQGPNIRPASRMKANPIGSQQTNRMNSGFKVSQNGSRTGNDNYSDDDYEEDFQDNANDDG